MAIPKFSPDDIMQFLRDHYGKDFTITSLPSYIDQNFRLKDRNGLEFIFKIFNSEENEGFLDATVRVLKHLEERGFSGKAPSVLPQKNGQYFCEIEGSEAVIHKALLLDFLKGNFLVEVEDHSPGLLRSFGVFLGKLTCALIDFDHPNYHRFIKWDLKHAHLIRDKSHYIQSVEKRRIAEYFLYQFENQIIPKLRKCRTSVVHHDANDYNILVDNGEVSGIIDFGDMVHSNTIFELAIGMTYAMLNKEDPLEAAIQIVAGYHQEYPLLESELELLIDLVCTRLSFSVINSAYSKTQEPDNDYILVTEKQAWALLEKLLRVNRDAATDKLLVACGFDKKIQTDKSELVKLRNTKINTALSISYDEPVHIVKGTFQYLYDDEGHTYLDCVNNVSHVGHCHHRILEAAARQMSELNTNTRYLHEHLINYAEALTNTLPDNLEVCIFTCSGSEANDLALRMARNYTERKDMLVLEGAYHGNTTAVIEVSPYKYNSRGGKGKPDHIHELPMPDPYRGKYRDEENQSRLYVAEVKNLTSQLLRQERPPAGFICESLLGCGGQVVMPDFFMRDAFEVIRSAGGVCIADEVQVGFGRVGTHFWGFETQQAIPDIVTLGKPIGNGHPMGAVITTKAIAEAFDNGMEYFNTFGGNPVSCAIGVEVLNIIKDEQLQENALETGGYLIKNLISEIGMFPLVGDIRGKGLFLGIELIKDPETLEPATDEASQVINKMKEKGVLLSTDGPFNNVIKFKPPMVFNRTNADQVVRQLSEVLKEFSHN